MKKLFLIAVVFLVPLCSSGGSPPAAGPASLTITTTSLPAAVQYQSYTAPALTATGGTPPYAWSLTGNTSYATLPEGMSLNSSTGAISSSSVGGQGAYEFQVQVEDSAGNIATTFLTLSVTADNSLGGCSTFPTNSIFHQRVDSLPLDTSPAAPIPAAYQSEIIQSYFGSDAEPYPDGIPFIRVPYNQPLVTISWLLYGSESDPSPYPFPANAPIEATANDERLGGDGHVLVLQTPGGGKPCQLWEAWQAVYDGNTTWSASNGAHWDLSSNNLRPLNWTSADAAGLPIMPLLLNYDEVASRKITHPVRFTLNNMLNYIVWPARHAAGIGSCSNGSNAIPVQSLLSQSSPPASCTFSGPSGEIYRLKASVDTSVCNGFPQSSAILTAMKQYGIILADNGHSGALIGTPDARWNDTDLGCLRNFTLSQFEPVNVSSLQVNPDSGATSVGSPHVAPPTKLTVTVK